MKHCILGSVVSTGTVMLCGKDGQRQEEPVWRILGIVVFWCSPLFKSTSEPGSELRKSLQLSSLLDGGFALRGVPFDTPLL